MAATSLLDANKHERTVEIMQSGPQQQIHMCWVATATRKQSRRKITQLDSLLFLFFKTRWTFKGSENNHEDTTNQYSLVLHADNLN